MGFGESSLFLKINLVVLIFAVILDLIGLAIPYWVAVDTNTLDYNYGLWQLCMSSCTSFTSVQSWLAAVQAFAIIGFLVLICALVFTIVAIFVKNTKIIKLVAWILSFVAALCILIEWAVFVDNTNTSSSNVGYSGGFALTIIAFILALVAGVIGVIDWVMKGSSS